MRRIVVLLLLCGSVLAAVPACRSGRAGQPSPLAQHVIGSPGAGFAEVPGATGPLPLALAARATTLRRDVLRPYLRRNGYTDGHSAVWSRGEEFVTVLLLDFFDARNARGLVELVVRELASSPAYAAFTDPGLPQTRGFTLTSDVNGRVRFCAVTWSWQRELAIGVTRCAPHPVGADAVTQLTRDQLARLPVSSAS